MADDVGSLLLRAGIVANEQLEAARRAVKETGGTVPEQLVRRGYIGDEELTSFYRSRLLIPRVNPSELAKLSKRLLEKVPADMASEFRAIPVSLDEEGNLVLVMSDPSDTKAVDEIGFFTGNFVMRAIATQAQIAWCLAHYYKQKTGLYRDLVADGQWPAVDGEASDLSIEGSERETAPIPSREVAEGKKGKKARARKSSARSKRNSESNTIEMEVDDETGPMKKRAPRRPANQQPSPPELFARAGEIVTIEKPARVMEENPAVLVALDKEEAEIAREVQRGTDTAPILLSAVKERLEMEESGPIILDNSRRKRRTSRRTSLGVGSVGTERIPTPLEKALADHASGPVILPEELREAVRAAQAEASDEAKAALSQAAPKAAAKAKAKTKAVAKAKPEPPPPQTDDMVGEEEAWGKPGTTIPPAFLGAAPSSYEDVAAGIPVAVDEAVTSEIYSPDSSIPVPINDGTDRTIRTEAPLEVRQTGLADAASKLLSALRAIDQASNKTEIIEPMLTFLDLAFERTGFLALRQDDLVSWRLHACPDDAQTRISIDDESTLKDVVRMRLPFNGPVEGQVTKQLARDLDIPDALDILALPMTVRDRVVGVLIGLSSHGKIFEEHITVLSQAASEAFERILIKRS